MRIRWSDRARDDLYAILAYIAEDNPDAASRLHDRLEAAIERLKDHPEMGRPGRVAGTRELVVKGTRYIVPYRVRGQYVEVITVMHSAREWPEGFE
jgi:toxin ParE1/3/4